MNSKERYYLTEVDKTPESIYCHHGTFDESFVPAHRHKKGQFLYTEGGIVYVRTSTKTFFLPSRHFIWIAPSELHSIHPSTEKAVMRNLYFPVDTLTEFTGTTRIYPVNDLLFNLLEYTASVKGDILPEDENYTIARAFFILLQKFSSFSLPLALPFPQDEKLRDIVRHLNEHLGSKITLPDIAQHFEISLRSLTRLFSRDLNMTFIEYLTILRLLKALELLLETNKSVSEICFSVGYNSVPTFSNVFYKMIGVRPAEYRKVKSLPQ